MDIDVPAQCDGYPLTPFLRGEMPERWRTAAHWEYDWRARRSPPHRTSGHGIGAREASPRRASRRPTTRMRSSATAAGSASTSRRTRRGGRRRPTRPSCCPQAQSMLTWRPSTPIARSPIWSSGWTAAAGGRHCQPAGARRPERRTAWSSHPCADLCGSARGLELRRQAQRRSVHRALGQFFVAGLIAAVVLAATRTLPAAGWGGPSPPGPCTCRTSSPSHWPTNGRVLGRLPPRPRRRALLAGIGGIILLGDELNGWAVTSIVVVTGGMALLASEPADRRSGGAVRRRDDRLLHGDRQPRSREVDDNTYALAIFLMGGLFVTAFGVAVGCGRDGWRPHDAVAAIPGHSGDEHTGRAVLAAAAARRVRRRAA